ncbi:CYTH and CHAD domain-containing protein [Mycolicibacterium sp. XJ1819]
MAGKIDRHTEVERRFDVVDTTVAPSFDGLASVTRVERSPSQHLDAVYFDTPGRDLATHHITLRRRTGGSDAGWHLKLPAGPDARTEVRTPLGTQGDEVPVELRDVVLAIVRDRPLAPITRIATHRTIDVLYRADGVAVAEFCDDQVTAQGADDEAPLRWREWEVELVDDTDRDLLDRLANRLLDAGAVPAGHSSKLARALDSDPKPAPDAEPADPVHRAVAEQIEALLVWDRAVRADAPDSVHQMRVTIRRIRSLLQSAEGSRDGWILDELRQLAAILGVARDAEVLAERYERALDELPSALVRGPVRKRLVDGAKRRYQTGWKRSMIAMRSQRYFGLLDGLDRLVTAAPEPGEDREAASVDAAYKRVSKSAKDAAEAGDTDRDEALHRIRKGAKRLRYVAAAMGADRVAERAKAVQTLLGEYQDSVVSRAHLSQQAEAAHAAGEDTFTYGLLHQREEDLARRSRRQLDKALARLKKAVREAR